MRAVRAGAGRAPGAEVPDHLRRQRVPNVLAPLPTEAGPPWVDLDRFALMLYPMIDGRTGADAGLSAQQWRELGAATNRVHAVPLPPALGRRVGRESFRPAGRQVVADLEPLMTRSVTNDPLARELAAVWRPRQGVIRALVDQVDAIGRQLEQSSFPLVLCHGDPWAVQEIVIFGREVALSPTLGEGTRRAALDGFRKLFEPGNIVDLARASATALDGQRRAGRPL